MLSVGLRRTAAQWYRHDERHPSAQVWIVLPLHTARFGSTGRMEGPQTSSQQLYRAEVSGGWGKEAAASRVRAIGAV